MPNDRQQKMIKKHAIETLALSVQQASDWVEFYQTDQDKNETLIWQWERTLNYRIKLLKQAEENVSDSTTTI